MEGQGAATDASLAAVDSIAAEVKFGYRCCQHVSLSEAFDSCWVMWSSNLCQILYVYR